ncbi:hypothetical protein D1BOALGB6SA_3073 [Olavius sp. associated proteobacterium Delta 1]|nr:hypothetical protein D1BOALGB6SA_3073 [Olavius sp. associated proteobacterium Delta 1]
MDPLSAFYPSSRMFRPDLSFEIISLNINERMKKVKMVFFNS